MKCPFCSYEESKVIDSRLVADSSQIRRRRECNKCNERWTTFELAELLMPKIVKQDKSRVPFDEIKLKVKPFKKHWIMEYIKIKQTK